MKKVILLLISSIVLICCGDIDECSGNSERTSMVVRFFDSETKTAKKSGFRISLEGSAVLFDLNADSLSVELPLNPQDTTVSFVFDTDTIDHQMRVRYDKEISIFDPDCDPSILFVGLDTLSSSFDSTVVVGTVTDRQLNTNIEVYF